MYLPSKDKYILMLLIQFLTILNLIIFGIVIFENIWMLIASFVLIYGTSFYTHPLFIAIVF